MRQKTLARTTTATTARKQKARAKSEGRQPPGVDSVGDALVVHVPRDGGGGLPAVGAARDVGEPVQHHGDGGGAIDGGMLGGNCNHDDNKVM